MPLHRRAVLTGATAAIASLSLPRFSVASVVAGAGRLTTISDGHLTLPRSFLLGEVTEEQAAPIFAAHGLDSDTVHSPCNVTLYQDADRVILFDVGSGTEFMPSAGDLIDGLDAASIAPEDVTDILFTHGHPDHLWGLLDDFGDPAFPEAKLLIGKDEWDYWTDPATVENIDSGRQVFAVGAKRRLELVEDQIDFFDDGDEVLPGISAFATYGHTPGHMSFQVGASDSVFVIGDAVANSHLSFANPSWKVGADQAPEQAAATRAALMERLAAEQMRVVGYHFPDGGMGRIERAETGYRFVGESQ